MAIVDELFDHITATMRRDHPTKDETIAALNELVMKIEERVEELEEEEPTEEETDADEPPEGTAV